jgi:glycosyltransferase involved in cell wall biosynthesis
MCSRKHIVLITSGQPSTNPRLVKEADFLNAMGHNVTVLYCYWNHWATLADQTLMRSRKWKLIRIAGSPASHAFSYYASKLSHRIAKISTRLNLNFNFSIYALSRATLPLARAAMHIPADLYLAHNLAALPAAVKAAKRYQAIAGFDAEDYHRGETRASVKTLEYRLKVMIEDLYISQLDYFTTSSSHIADLYHNHYHRRPTVIRNLMPTVYRPHHQITTTFAAAGCSAEGVANPNTLTQASPSTAVKLLWFSQTIGPDRGIELIIKALKYIESESYELHLLGAPKPGYIKQLLGLASAHSVPWTNLHFHKPIAPESLIQACASFDIGLASEPGFCPNNDAALSNKLFTYIQAGLVVLLSDTTAQKSFYQQHPTIGMCYKKDSATALAGAIQHYIDHQQVLADTKTSNYLLGQESLNWESESQILFHKIKATLN